MGVNNGDQIVIIGASSAGIAAVGEIGKINETCKITMISKEDIKGYFRPKLSEMLSDDSITVESIAVKNDKWFQDNNVELLLDKLVTQIDSDNKKVILKDGDEIDYTKLIIASGAEVFVPPFEGREKEGVFTLRYVKDVNAIKEYAKGKKTAAVIGGGVLGLEASDGLKNLGLQVTVIEQADRILPRQLDKDASKLLEDIVKDSGVIFKKGLGTKEIIGDNNVEGVLLDNGEIVDADIVIISTGVRANSQIAEGNNIEINRAIVVNNKMETSVPDIYACGDCAEYDGINYALWREASEQGKTAGINAAGGNYVYETIIPFTTLDAFDSSVFSIGDGSNPDIEYEIYEDYDGENLKKLYFDKGIFTGGILIGDTSKKMALNKGLRNNENMEELIEKIKS